MEVDISGVTVRLVLRILFTIMFLFLGFVGSFCNDLAQKIRLLHGEQIRVSETSGWLGLGGLLEGIWKLRRIGNVKWWSLMAIIGILSKLSDLATAAVQDKYLQSFCNFGTGMVLSPDITPHTYPPPWNGRAYFVSATAQLTSQTNGCSKGIFRKVNDDPMFCAAEKDLLGSWSCASVGQDLTYSHGNYTQEQIVLDLVVKELLYPDASSIRTETGNVYDFSHLVAWSSSTYDGSDETFTVRASIDTTADSTDDKIMHNMNCSMNAPGANGILSSIPSSKSLSAWVQLFQGYMYEGSATASIPDPETTIAWYLNSMVMVTGGSNYLLNNAPIEDPKQGCLVLTTIIPYWLVAIFLLTVLACILMAILAICLWIRVRRHTRRQEVENAPLDLWSWMAQGVAESEAKTDEGIPTVLPKELSRWTIGLGTGNVVRVGRRETEMQPLRA